MKQYGLLWIVLAGWLLTGQSARAQCDKIYSTIKDLRKSTTLKPEQRILKATEIQRKWLECGLQADSTFIWLQIFNSNQFRRLNLPDSARKAIDQALRLAQHNGQAGYLLAQAHCVSGYLYLAESRADLAKKDFFLALKQAAKWPESRSWGIQAQVNLAYLCSSEGDYQQAITHAEEGRQWALALHDYGSEAQLLYEKAFALYSLSHSDEASSSIQQAIRSAAVAQETAMEPYYLLLGDIENKRNHIALAVDAYQQAASFAKRSGDKALLALGFTNLGFLYYQQKDYSRAIKFNQQALVLQDNTFSRARIFDNLAACYWKIREFDKALATYQKGFISLPIGFDKVLPSQNPSASSVRLTLRKEVLLTLIQDKADTWLDYARATDNNPKRLKHALATYTVADQMIDFMRWEHTGQQSKLFWRQKTRGMYERAIETCFLLGDAEQAFRFLEKSRAVMLTDKLNELGARQQLTEPQMAKEQQLRQAVNNQQTTLAGLPPDNGPAYNAARMALFAKQDSLTAFLKNLEISNKAYYQYKYDNTTIALADVQLYLKKQSGSLITYFVGDSALYVLAITADKAILRKHSVTAYANALHQFARLLANPTAMSRRDDVSRFLGLSNELYRQLLAPSSLPKGRVIVSPDGFFVPFDALSRSADKADFAVSDYAFSYVYSVGLLLKSDGKQNRDKGFRSTDFLGVAPVEFAPGLNQVLLPRSDEALNSIAGRFAAPTLLTHDKATKAAFLGKAATARVIHLFTHATADSSDREPALYFADSTLQLSGLSDGVLSNAELVVLAACKTGIGANQRGEGVFSLARGFAALGVPSVLTTLWSVQNEATYELTDLFYSYLDQGLPKDVALQRAKQDWLNTAEGENQLPNNWAGLILVGDSKPLIHLSYSPWVGILSLLAIIGLGGIWFWQNRERRSTAVFSAAHSA